MGRYTTNVERCTNQVQCVFWLHAFCSETWKVYLDPRRRIPGVACEGTWVEEMQWVEESGQIKRETSTCWVGGLWIALSHVDVVCIWLWDAERVGLKLRRKKSISAPLWLQWGSHNPFWNYQVDEFALPGSICSLSLWDRTSVRFVGLTVNKQIRQCKPKPKCTLVSPGLDERGFVWNSSPHVPKIWIIWWR